MSQTARNYSNRLRRCAVQTFVALTFVGTLSACGGGGGTPGPSVLPVNVTQSRQAFATAWGVQLHLSSLGPSLGTVKSDLGASFVRLDLARDWVLANGWSAYDNAMAEGTAAGLQMMFILPDVRYTANPDKIDHPPYDLAAYTAFVRSAVARYAGKHVIWEILNEPNIHTYFGAAAITPADYIGIVRAVAPVIRSADPSSTIITGGTSGVALDWQTSISAIFPLVDGVGVHPYGETPSGLVSDLQSVAAQSGGKPIFVTEYGVATADQAQQLSDQLGAAKGQVPFFNVYEYQDQTPQDNYGLLMSSGRQRPAYAAVKAIFHS